MASGGYSPGNVRHLVSPRGMPSPPTAAPPPFLPRELHHHHRRCVKRGECNCVERIASTLGAGRRAARRRAHAALVHATHATPLSARRARACATYSCESDAQHVICGSPTPRDRRRSEARVGAAVRAAVQAAPRRPQAVAARRVCAWRVAGGPQVAPTARVPCIGRRAQRSAAG
eukprot:3966981-Prymnesium_polylepis.1